MNQRAGAYHCYIVAIATHQASDAGFLRIRAFLPLIPDYPEALTRDSIMDIQDTFPQRVGKSSPTSIPEGFVTTYGDVARLPVPRAARQVGGVLKRLPEGSVLYHGIGW